MAISLLILLIILLSVCPSSSAKEKDDEIPIIPLDSDEKKEEITISEDIPDDDQDSITVGIPRNCSPYDISFDIYSEGNIGFPKVYLHDDGKCPLWIDVNNDGYSEIVLGTYGQNFLFVNNCDGTFTKKKEFGIIDTQIIFPADCDKDGDMDFAVSNQTGPSSIYYNRGGFEFEQIQFEDDGTMAYATIWGDPDEDGDLDLVLVNGDYGDADSWKNAIMINKGNGTFERKYCLGSENSVLMAWVDLNGDELADICLNNIDSFQFFINDGNCTFSEIIIDKDTQRNIGPNTGYHMVFSKDYDDDGFRDIFIQVAGYWFVIENNNYSFFHNTSYDGLYSFQSTDIDNDNSTDIIFCEDGLYIMIQEGDYTRKYLVDRNVTRNADFSLDDFDLDGDLDILVGESNSAYLYVNDLLYRTRLNLTRDLHKFMVQNPDADHAYISVRYPNRVVLEINNTSIKFGPEYELDDDQDDDAWTWLFLNIIWVLISILLIITSIITSGIIVNFRYKKKIQRKTNEKIIEGRVKISDGGDEFFINTSIADNKIEGDK